MLATRKHRRVYHSQTRSQVLIFVGTDFGVAFGTGFGVDELRILVVQLFPFFGPTSILLGGPSPMAAPGSSAKDTHPSLGSGFPICTNLYKMVNFWPKKA